jgi:hypothetical protein
MCRAERTQTRLSWLSFSWFIRMRSWECPGTWSATEAVFLQVSFDPRSATTLARDEGCPRRSTLKQRDKRSDRTRPWSTTCGALSISNKMTGRAGCRWPNLSTTTHDTRSRERHRQRHSWDSEGIWPSTFRRNFPKEARPMRYAARRK